MRSHQAYQALTACMFVELKLYGFLSVLQKLEEQNDASGDGEGGGGSRDDYSAEDVEYYFNYSGILADQGSYDQLEDLLECEYCVCTYLALVLVIPRAQPSLQIGQVGVAVHCLSPRCCLHRVAPVMLAAPHEQ